MTCRAATSRSRRLMTAPPSGRPRPAPGPAAGAEASPSPGRRSRVRVPWAGRAAPPSAPRRPPRTAAGPGPAVAGGEQGQGAAGVRAGPAETAVLVPGPACETDGEVLAGPVVRVLAAHPVPARVRVREGVREQAPRARVVARRLCREQRGRMQQSARRARDERFEVPGRAGTSGRLPFSHRASRRTTRTRSHLRPDAAAGQGSGGTHARVCTTPITTIRHRRRQELGSGSPTGMPWAAWRAESAVLKRVRSVQNTSRSSGAHSCVSSAIN